MRGRWSRRARRVTFAGIGVLLVVVGTAAILHDSAVSRPPQVLGETLSSYPTPSTLTCSATAPTVFCVTADSTPLLFPNGLAQSLKVTFTNPQNIGITVTSLTVQWDSSKPFPSGCYAHTFSVGGVPVTPAASSPPAPAQVTVPVPSSVGVIPAGYSADFDPTITMNNSGNQNACQKYQMLLDYSATAQFTDSTTTVLTASPSPVNPSSGITLKATVKASNAAIDTSASPVPTGTVTFSLCGPASSAGNCLSPTVIGSQNLSAGSASQPATAPANPGPYYYQAVFIPTSSTQPNFSGSSGIGSEIVQGPTCIANLMPTGYTVTTIPSVAYPSPYKGNYEVKPGNTLFLNGGTINGNVTVDSGAALDAVGGTILGNVQGNGGQIALTGTNVTGNVQGSASSIGLGPNTTVGGNVQPSGGTVFCSSGSSGQPVSIGNNLQIQNLASTTNPVTICNTSIKGNLQYQNNAAPVVIGGSSSCLGNSIGGNLQVQSNSAKVTIGGSGTGWGNTVGGNLQVQTNTGGGTLTNNTASGNCQLQGNKPPITGSGNSGKNNSCNGAA